MSALEPLLAAGLRLDGSARGLLCAAAGSRASTATCP